MLILRENRGQISEIPLVLYPMNLPAVSKIPLKPMDSSLMSHYVNPIKSHENPMEYHNFPY